MHRTPSPNIKKEILESSALIKENISLHSSRKFAGTTLTQNFFASDLDQDYLSFSQTSQTARPTRLEENPTVSKQTEGRSSLRKSRRKVEKAVLEPQKQEKKVDIYSTAVIPRLNNDDVEEIFVGTTLKEANELLTGSEIGSSHRRKTHRKSDKKEYEERMEEKSQSKAESKKIEFGAATQLFFDQNPEPTKIEDIQQQKPAIKVPIPKGNKNQQVEELQFTLPKRNFDHFFNDDDQEPTENSHIHPQLPKNQYESALKGSEYFNFENEVQLREQLLKPITDKLTLRMEVVRDKGGLNVFWPEFELRFTADKQRVICAKKTSSRPTSTFLISRTNIAYEEENAYYFGKVKSTSLGDAYNIFGPGLNPSKAKAKGVNPRELLATLVYTTSLFKDGGPRQFSLYQVEPGYSYYEDFTQVVKYEEEVPLNVLYSYSNNKQKIRILHNRKPVWTEETGTYLLNLRGMAERPSVKNFVLESENGREVVLFGKQSDNVFNLDVSTGISPYLAFCVAIVSFDTRIILQ